MVIFVPMTRRKSRQCHLAVRPLIALIKYWDIAMRGLLSGTNLIRPDHSIARSSWWRFRAASSYIELDKARRMLTTIEEMTATNTCDEGSQSMFQ